MLDVWRPSAPALAIAASGLSGRMSWSSKSCCSWDRYLYYWVRNLPASRIGVISNFRFCNIMIDMNNEATATMQSCMIEALRSGVLYHEALQDSSFRYNRALYRRGLTNNPEVFGV